MKHLFNIWHFWHAFKRLFTFICLYSLTQKGEEFNNKTNTPHSQRAFDLVFIEQTKAIIKIITCTRTESKMNVTTTIIMIIKNRTVARVKQIKRSLSSLLCCC